MRVLLIFSTLLLSSWAQAQIVLNPNITYHSRNLENNNSNVGKVSTLTLDTKAGYIFDFGLFTGIQVGYSMGKSGDLDLTTYQLGPTVGYSCNVTGLFLTATYHLLGKADWDTAGEYGKVTGLQLDFGYPITISDTFKFGPQISYKRLKYEDGEPSSLQDDRTKELTPYFGFWFYF